MPRKHGVDRAEFARLGAEARRIHGTLFSLSVSWREDDAGVRLACVASKEVAKEAVRRNMLKRRCREAARKALSSLPGSATLVFRAKRAAARSSFLEIERDVRDLVEKASRTRYNSRQ